MNRLLLAATTATLLAGPAMAAPAASSDNPAPARTVSIKQVDFSNPVQVRRLYDKVLIAVRDVCDPQSMDQASLLAQRACERANMDQAIRAVDAPQLTALYNVNGQAPAYAGR